MNDKYLIPTVGIELSYAVILLMLGLIFTVLSYIFTSWFGIAGSFIVLSLLIYGRFKYKKNLRWLDELRVNITRKQFSRYKGRVDV